MRARKPIEFNAKAHQLVTASLDHAERIIVKRGVCDAADASTHLADTYIRETASIMFGATVYLVNDEIHGADIFLDMLRVSMKPRNPRGMRDAAEQLVAHTSIYFPNFDDRLSFAFAKHVASTSNPQQLKFSGLTLLAAANLPGYIVDIRRMLRRLGYEYDPTLVPDSELIQKHTSSGKIVRFRLDGPPKKAK